MSKAATYIARKTTTFCYSQVASPNLFYLEKCKLSIDKITSQESLTDPESATSVFTSGTGLHALDRVVILKGLPFAISSRDLLLVLISQIPKNE